MTGEDDFPAQQIEARIECFVENFRRFYPTNLDTLSDDMAMENTLMSTDPDSGLETEQLAGSTVTTDSESGNENCIEGHVIQLPASASCSSCLASDEATSSECGEVKLHWSMLHYGDGDHGSAIYRPLNRKYSSDDSFSCSSSDSSDCSMQNVTDYVMGDSGCSLTVLDVADLLQKQYAIITGGRSAHGRAIITFPDSQHNSSTADVTEEQYNKVVTYLTSIPSLQEVDLGFCLIVDRRRGNWDAVKTILSRISAFFPGLVHEVFVIRPSNAFNRYCTNLLFKWNKEDYKFKVLMCSSIEDLHKHVPPDQLTSVLGGSLEFEHKEWIQHRAAIEKFSANTSHIGHTLRKFCEHLEETEFPNNVEATDALIHEHERESKLVRDDLVSNIKHGEGLLDCFRTVAVPATNGEDSSAGALKDVEDGHIGSPAGSPELARDDSTGGLEEVALEEVALDDVTSQEGGRPLPGNIVRIPSYKLSPSKHAHVTAVEKLLSQLEETRSNFDKIWIDHEVRLHQCLLLRKYEEDFKQIQCLVSSEITMLLNMSDSGDSVNKVQHYITELQDLEAKNGIGKAEELKKTGEDLIEDKHYAVDCIRPKCLELQRMCEQYRELVRQRYDLLNRAKDLHERIDQANNWCSSGMDLLDSATVDPVPGLAATQSAKSSLTDIDMFIQSSDTLQLNDPQQFYEKFASVITPQLKTTIQSVLQRIDEVRSLCMQRRVLLVDTIAKNNRLSAIIVPPEPTTPPPRAPKIGRGRRRKSLSSAGSPANGHSRSIEIVHGSDISSDTSSSIDIDTEVLYHGSHDNSSQDSEYIRDYSTLHAKRGHVMRELIETERVYVEELDQVLRGYYAELDNPVVQESIPHQLHNNRDVLFGNLQQIHHFHANIFLKDLENCKETPALVGKCIVDRKEEFQMYSFYCQNKTKSEALRKEIGDNHPFFKQCQKNLDHKLPIGAYLLKPVQRITKYQLLLKEMLRFTDESPASTELKGALDTMLGVLKYVNDIMHQVGITGFQGELSQLGKLLMQGPFQVWHENKRDIKIIDIRFKPMQRHLFLYEKSVIFCKKINKDDIKCAELEGATYIYKSSISTKNIGLTESCRGDKRKFELWLHGHKEIYTIQAPNMSVKKDWVQVVKKVLMTQFDQIKETAKKDVPIMRLKSIDQKAVFDTVDHNVANNNQVTLLQYDSSSLDSDTHSSISGYTTATTSSTTHSTTNSTPPTTLGVSRGSVLGGAVPGTDVDDGGWSSQDEYEDEDSSLSSAHAQNDLSYGEVQEYTVIANYQPTDVGELSLREGDTVEVLKVGTDGWWYVRYCGMGGLGVGNAMSGGTSPVHSVEGWAPAGYFDANKRRSRSTISLSSSDSVNGLCGVRGQSSNRLSSTSNGIVTTTTTVNNTCVTSTNTTSHIELSGASEETLV